MSHINTYADSKIHGANIGATSVLTASDGPHFGPMKLAIWVKLYGSLTPKSGVSLQ